MKKVFAVIIALVLICSVALAEVDLSGMSFDELVELEKQVIMAIMQSDGWQEVVVPQGTYKVGEDIPAGKWMVKYNNGYATIKTDDMIFGADIEDDEDYIATLKEGQMVEIKWSSVIFSPYTGSLGFK